MAAPIPIFTRFAPPVNAAGIVELAAVWLPIKLIVFPVAVLPAAVSTGLLSPGRLMAVVAAAFPTGLLSLGRLMIVVELVAPRADEGTEGMVYGL